MNSFSYEIPSLTLIGQSAFTCYVLDYLTKYRVIPTCVAIEAHEVDYDPFFGLSMPENHEWYLEHVFYHYGWRQKIRDICKKFSIPLIYEIDVANHIEKSDILIIAGYAKKFPESKLSNYKGWAINVHPSLLPMFKGPQPEAQIIINNQCGYTGVTLHEITNIWDSGDIYYQEKYDYLPYLTVGDMERLEAEIAATAIIKLYRQYPHINKIDIENSDNSSYFTWYDTNLLKIPNGSIEDIHYKKLFWLRPEGYAYIETTEGNIFPIINTKTAISTKSMMASVLGAVIKCDSNIEYINHKQVMELEVL